jgi:hypothetical protein
MMTFMCPRGGKWAVEDDTYCVFSSRTKKNVSENHGGWNSGNIGYSLPMKKMAIYCELYL